MSLLPLLLALFALGACGGGVGDGDGGTPMGRDAAAMDAGGAGDGATRDGGSADAFAEPDASVSLRVLFVGNSYTYANDLPGVVRAIGSATPGVSVEVESVTMGGARLADHWATTGARERIATGAFDAVVLQGQSLETVFSPADFDLHGELFAGALAEVGADGVWFATWARRDVESDPLTLMSAIEARYQAAAAHNGDVVARVGAAWEIALLAMPGVVLFAPDRSHPSSEGTLLASCVIFQALTGLAPQLPDPPPLGIPADVARPLCAIADEGVPCDPAESFCDGACVPWDTDSCGGCGIVCADGDPCRLGVCGCAPGLTGCSEVCTDLTTSVSSCGACGASCALGAVCESGVCACPSTGDADVDVSALTAFDTSCATWSDAGSLGCNAAAHGYCEAVGDSLECFTSGFGPPSGNHGPTSSAVMCVNGDVRTSTYTALSTHVPACDGVGERIGPSCTTAIHRWCVAAGAVSGFGPIDAAGDTVTFTCISDADVVRTTITNLSAFASRCVPDPVTCSAASWNYCESLGYGGGFGPVEVIGDVADVVCVDDGL